MTLNRVPESMRKDIIELQQYHELTERMKNNDKFYYWQSRKRSNLFFKTLEFRNKIDNCLGEKDKTIFYLRYILGYPIMKIVNQTGYSKRMIQYKLNDIIIKLEEGPSVYNYIKKHKMKHQFTKEYIAPSTLKKVQ